MTITDAGAKVIGDFAVSPASPHSSDPASDQDPDFTTILEALETASSTPTTSPTSSEVDFAAAALTTSVSLQDEFGESPNTAASLVLLAHIKGTHPHQYTAHTPHSLHLRDVLVHTKATLHRSSREFRPYLYQVALSTKDAWFAIKSDSGGASVAVYATSATRAQELASEIIALATAHEMDTDTTPMSFIHASARGTPRYDSRSITTPDWNDIAANYNEKASQSLAETMALTAPEGTARLLLMYGPPGTGKTTAIRALSRAWHPWCDTVVVLDPDQLFTNLDYLQATILDEPEEPTGKWTLFVIEDADEIITAKAKDLTGQALSRLLNITDGIVGQGVKALFLITTNEPVKELHPAIKRDGRCLVDIDVQPLSVAEAQKWLADRGLADVPLTEPQTIAQLYGHLTTTPVKTPPAPTPSAGQYL